LITDFFCNQTIVTIALIIYLIVFNAQAHQFVLVATVDIFYNQTIVIFALIIYLTVDIVQLDYFVKHVLVRFILLIIEQFHQVAHFALIIYLCVTYALIKIFALIA
jgi:hypothetical protein